MEPEIELFVAVPFGLLRERYLEPLIKNGLNPEIGLDPKTLDHYTADSQREIFERLKATGITHTFHFPFVDMDPGSPDRLIREATKKRFEMALDWVIRFFPRMVVVHTGYFPLAHGEIREEWLSSAVDTFSWLGEKLSKYSIPWALENVFETGPEEILPVVEKLEGLGAGICLDVGHLTSFSSTPLILWLRELSAHIVHLHLHDNRGHRDEHLGLGHGKVEFETLFEILRGRNAPIHTITIEPHLEEMVLTSLEHLKSLCPYKVRKGKGTKSLM
ncbi:MAG: sugar phosphate isomerase/epimerase family protein [Desulfatiglandales bacterium]